MTAPVVLAALAVALVLIVAVPSAPAVLLTVAVLMVADALTSSHRDKRNR